MRCAIGGSRLPMRSKRALASRRMRLRYLAYDALFVVQLALRHAKPLKNFDRFKAAVRRRSRRIIEP